MPWAGPACGTTAAAALHGDAAARWRHTNNGRPLSAAAPPPTRAGSSPSKRTRAPWEGMGSSAHAEAQPRPHRQLTAGDGRAAPIPMHTARARRRPLCTCTAPPPASEQIRPVLSGTRGGSGMPDLIHRLHGHARDTGGFSRLQPRRKARNRARLRGAPSTVRRAQLFRRPRRPPTQSSRADKLENPIKETWGWV